ncbi:unnamed protein product (macronuclear) [Paramecium tetraurelia]|uniref:Cation-transporting P-type ATPase N-terminal domain-containing protein n=1 Tax=Paramecium tetraurelia TaxID=5888 RepID=A0C6G1_PARTE|nr:uncharacterized protein GSPATT00035507001 [Paramecium tetraurelia]CAK66378.1 unnamed protein product [Paramecium tetraurelia]|eukprot:XP_001433775.1 hypothetical protein (macronuclear) [Paramecium tetraurelia strain d4-2]
MEEQRFQISYPQMQSMFDTANLSSGQSAEILHQLGDVESIMVKLETDSKNGIAEVEGRQEQFGSNRLEPPKLSPFYKCMYKQTKDFCIRILAFATVIMFMMAFFSEEPFEQIVQAFSILIAICAVVIIGAMTDYRKEKQFRQLYLEQEEQQKKLFQVVRNGNVNQMNHLDLLVGDIITIKPGDNITVDGLLLEGTETVEVDESMISGLTDTISKQPISKGLNCFIRGGSNIFEGTAKVVVLAVGSSTYSNRMKHDNQQKEEGEEELIHDERSPLAKALETLAKFLVFIGCMSALAMFIVLELYMVRELNELQEKIFSQFALKKVLSDFIDAFLIIVLSIPEGLPLIVTLSLAFSIAKLRQHDIVIRNLHVCQVLGGVDTLCFDKTGTLTYNNLKVSNLHVANEERVNNIPPHDPLFRILSEAILSTNSAFLPDEIAKQLRFNEQLDLNSNTNKKTQEHAKMLQSVNDASKKSDWSGNRLDVALIDYLEVKLRREFVVEYLQDLKNQIRKTIPLNNYGFHAEILQVRGDKYRIVLKGKAKDIIEKCNQLNISIPDNQNFQIYEPGNFTIQYCAYSNMTTECAELEKNAVLNYNSQSLKTISFAYKDVQIPNLIEQDWQQLLTQNNFTYIGTIAMRDDIRQEAKRLDSALKMGNMSVMILTGDTRVNTVNVANCDQADAEIQRTSEHLPKSSQLVNQQEIVIDPSTGEEQKSAQIISSIIECPKDEVQPLLSNDYESQYMKQHSFSNLLILNFQEYVIRIRKILKESNIYYTHQEVNERNIVSKIPEIQNDTLACDKVSKLNNQLQILADLNQHQKHQFLEVYSNINQSTIGYIGDGNNDAIALQTASVGITLGKTATNIARECSGIILMNDKLDGIELCMKYGRNIFLNIKRFIYFQLSFFLNSIAIMLTSSIVLKQQPYTVLEVIWLSLVQDIFSAVALSTEVPQDDILKRTKPAKRGENIIDKFLLQMTCTQAAFQYLATLIVLFLTPSIFGIEPSYKHDLHALGAEFIPEFAIHYTLVYHLTAMFQIVNLVCSRRIGQHEYNVFDGIHKNKPFTIMIVGLLIIQQVIIYAGGKYFKTAQLTIWQNMFCLCLSFGALLVFWLSKYLYSIRK